MFEYRMYKVNEAELLREAAAQRLVGEARATRRDRRRGRHAGPGAEGRTTHLRDLRDRFAHAA